MLEMIVLFMILSLVTACMFSPSSSLRFFSKTQLVAGDKVVDAGVVEKFEAPTVSRSPLAF